MNALSLTYADFTRSLSKMAESVPTIRDLSSFVRSHPVGPQNFSFMLVAAHVRDHEPVAPVKTRLGNCLPRWERAARNGHWSARSHPSRISAARTILAVIDEFEGVQ